jgi:hypothetical protein
MSVAVAATLAYCRLRTEQARDWLAAVRSCPGWRTVHHLVVFPSYNEPVGVLAESLTHLVQQDYPHDRISVVLAFEEREAGAGAKARELEQAFAGCFAHLWTTFHPDRPGEVAGKSSNLAYAVRWARRALAADPRVRLDRVLVTVCDSDARLDARYLSALTYRYLTERDPQYVFYQPAVLFHANIQRLPFPLRVLNSMYSVLHLSRMPLSFRLITQSNYSLSLELCHRVGYWDVDVIPEDSHMFFKALFRCGERVRVVPLFIPVWQIVRRGRRRLVPRYIHVVHYTHEHLLWPSHWFLLLGSFNLLSYLAPAFAASENGQELAGLATAAYTACLPSLFLLIWLNWQLRPSASRPSLGEVLAFLASWACLPLVSFVLVALPAVDAHSRLLLGRYLRYQVTEKQARVSLDTARPPASAARLVHPTEAA